MALFIKFFGQEIKRIAKNISCLTVNHKPVANIPEMFLSSAVECFRTAVGYFQWSIATKHVPDTENYASRVNRHLLSQSFIEPPVEDIAEVVGLFSDVEIIVKHEQQIGRDNKCGIIIEKCWWRRFEVGGILKFNSFIGSNLGSQKTINFNYQDCESRKCQHFLRTNEIINRKIRSPSSPLIE